MPGRAFTPAAKWCFTRFMSVTRSAAANHAQREPEGRRRFALAGAGVDDQQALLDLLVRNLGILHGLALRHLGAVTFGLGVIDIAHGSFPGSPFTSIGIPATIRTTR